MKCPSCGYLSFDDLDSCKKCGAELRSDGEDVKQSSFDLEEFFSEAGRDDADNGVRGNAWHIDEEAEEEDDGSEKSEVPETMEEKPEQVEETSGEPEGDETPATGSGIPWSEEIGEPEDREEVPDGDERKVTGGDEVLPEEAVIPPATPPSGESFIEELRKEAASSFGVSGEVPETAGEADDQSIEEFAEAPPEEPGGITTGEMPEDETYFQDFPLDLESEEAVEALSGGEIMGEGGMPGAVPLPEEPVEEAGEKSVTGVTADQVDTPGIPIYMDETVEEAGEEAIYSDEAAVLWGEQPAGFAWRAAAFTIDNLIIGFLNLVFLFGAAMGLLFKGVSFSWLVGTFWVADVLLPFYVLSLIISAVYFTYFHWSDGRTPGKRLFSIKVVDQDEEGIPLTVAVTRWMAYLVSAVPLGLGFIWALTDENGMAWHDRLTGTMVVGETDEST